MKKETLIKLLLLCGISEIAIRYCTHLGISVNEMEEMHYLILAEQDGRLEL